MKRDACEAKMKDKYYYEGELVKGTKDACGYDVVLQETQRIEPKTLSKIDIGLKFPEGLPSAAFLILRSAYHNTGMIQVSTGLIDQDYKGKLFLVVYSMRDTGIKLQKGARVVQLVFFNEVKPYEVKILREER